jgi:hypothetical protein
LVGQALAFIMHVSTTSRIVRSGRQARVEYFVFLNSPLYAPTHPSLAGTIWGGEMSFSSVLGLWVGMLHRRLETTRGRDLKICLLVSISQFSKVRVFYRGSAFFFARIEDPYLSIKTN